MAGFGFVPINGIATSQTRLLPVIGMNFKNEHDLPSHLANDEGLPRNREERLLWIRRKIEVGYYDDKRVIRAVADAFLEPGEARRAGDRSWRGGES